MPLDLGRGLPLELISRLSQLFLDLYMRGMDLALEQMNIELELTLPKLLAYTLVNYI